MQQNRAIQHQTAQHNQMMQHNQAVQGGQPLQQNRAVQSITVGQHNQAMQFGNSISHMQNYQHNQTLSCNPQSHNNYTAEPASLQKFEGIELFSFWLGDQDPPQTNPSEYLSDSEESHTPEKHQDYQEDSSRNFSEPSNIDLMRHSKPIENYADPSDRTLLNSNLDLVQAGFSNDNIRYKEKEAQQKNAAWKSQPQSFPQNTQPYQQTSQVLQTSFNTKNDKASNNNASSSYNDVQNVDSLDDSSGNTPGVKKTIQKKDSAGGDKKKLNYLFHRKARAKLATRFGELKAVLPNLPKNSSKNLNKNIILECAISYIREIKQRELKREANVIFASKSSIFSWLRGVCVEYPSIEATLPSVLQMVGIRYGWKYGELWRANFDTNEALRHVLGVVTTSRGNEDETLEADSGLTEEEYRMKEFKEKSVQLRFPRMVGLPGRVWNTGQWEWLCKTHDPSAFIRAAAAINANIEVGLGIPMIVNGKMYGVLTLFDTVKRELEIDTVEVISNIVSLIGSYYGGSEGMEKPTSKQT